MTGLKDATLNCSSKEERREKREERDKHDRDDRVEGGNGSVPEGRYGREKGQPLGGKREERREKREEGDPHDRDDRVEGRNGSNIEVRSAECDLRDEQMAKQRDGEAQG